MNEQNEAQKWSAKMDCYLKCKMERKIECNVQFKNECNRGIERKIENELERRKLDYNGAPNCKIRWSAEFSAKIVHKWSAK